MQPFTPQQRLVVENAISAYQTAREKRAALERSISQNVPVAADRKAMLELLSEQWRAIDGAVPEYVKDEYKRRRKSLILSGSELEAVRPN